jgi:hypothetical protein
MMEAVRTSETSVDNHFTRQYTPEDSSEHQVILKLSSYKVNILLLRDELQKIFHILFQHVYLKHIVDVRH